MSTQSQIAANQENARRSTGPQTPEGKAVVAQNATSHGLASHNFHLLPHENEHEFQDLQNSVADEFEPQTEHESFLVWQMACARYRLIRIGRLEALALDEICSGEPA